jgi:hypothetical protein
MTKHELPDGSVIIHGISDLSPQMTKHEFPDGSFFIHGISHLGPQRISAWFDAKGKPIGAQYMPSGKAVAMRHRRVRVCLRSLGSCWVSLTLTTSPKRRKSDMKTDTNKTSKSRLGSL